MAIQTTLGQLVAAADDTPDQVSALTRLATQRLPVKHAYDVKKIRQLVRPELQHWHDEREAFIKELGAEREPTAAERIRFGAGKVMAVKPEHEPAFQQRMAELAALAVSIAWQPIDLSTAGSVAISAHDLEVLGPLVTAGAFETTEPTHEA